VIRDLNGVKGATFARSDKVDVVRLLHYDGHQTLTAWAKTADVAQIQVSTSATEATLLDQYGHEQTVSPTNDEFSLSLTGARCNKVDKCAVGGNVQLLVLPPGDLTVQEVRSGQMTNLTFG